VGLVLVLAFCLVLHAQGAKIIVRLPNGLYVHKKVLSLREARFNFIVPQQYDLSCGSAALATILYYYYEEEVNEREIIEFMLEKGDQEKIARMGFSLLDLKHYAEYRDYMAGGFKNVDLEKLRKLKVPSIVLLKSGRYAHFVVLKGIKGDRAYIADPAFGNRSMPFKDFLASWNEVIFLVVKKQMDKKLAQLPLESVFRAPKMDVIRMQQVGPGIGLSGFSFFRTPGEF
jgi:predicted double-glycine peptidase